jgi:hypothetical protein
MKYERCVHGVEGMDCYECYPYSGKPVPPAPEKPRASIEGWTVMYVEKSAYDAVVKERDEFKAEITKLNRRLAIWDSFKIHEERDQALARVERLERALIFAKLYIEKGKYSESAGALQYIEELERGE